VTAALCCALLGIAEMRRLVGFCAVGPEVVERRRPGCVVEADIIVGEQFCALRQLFRFAHFWKFFRDNRSLNADLFGNLVLRVAGEPEVEGEGVLALASGSIRS
jgi:hypothetical protein